MLRIGGCHDERPSYDEYRLAQCNRLERNCHPTHAVGIVVEKPATPTSVGDLFINPGRGFREFRAWECRRPLAPRSEEPNARSLNSLRGDGIGQNGSSTPGPSRLIYSNVARQLPTAYTVCRPRHYLTFPPPLGGIPVSKISRDWTATSLLCVIVVSLAGLVYFVLTSH
jgi:hypothetical protein